MIFPKLWEKGPKKSVQIWPRYGTNKVLQGLVSGSGTEQGFSLGQIISPWPRNFI